MLRREIPWSKIGLGDRRVEGGTWVLWRFSLFGYVHTRGWSFWKRDAEGGTWVGRAVFVAAVVECTYRCESHAVEFALLGSIYSGIVYSLILSGFLHAVFECVKVVLGVLLGCG